MVVQVDIEVRGGVVTRIVTGMVIRDIIGVEGAGLELEVVASLGEDGLRLVWWKDLWVVVVLEKVKEMVRFWWNTEFVVK